MPGTAAEAAIRRSPISSLKSGLVNVLSSPVRQLVEAMRRRSVALRTL